MFKQLTEWRSERGLNSYNFESQIRCDVEELFELMGYDNLDMEYLINDFMERYYISTLQPKDTEKVDAHCDKIVFAVNAIEQLGYDAEQCMNETIKEISSRTGAINPGTKKWEKFKTEEAKAKWYKADYSKFKRVKNDR